MRHYPAQPTVNEQGCQDAPSGLISFPVNGLRAYPHAFPHWCISPETVAQNRPCVAEAAEFAPHPYEASTIRPVDAWRSLCRVCRSTHEGEP